LSASQPYRERGRWDIEVPVTGADGPAPARAGTAADPPLLRDLHGAGSRACGGGGVVGLVGSRDGGPFAAGL